MALHHHFTYLEITGSIHYADTRFDLVDGLIRAIGGEA